MQDFRNWQKDHSSEGDEHEDLEQYFAGQKGSNYATISQGEILYHGLPASGDLLKASEVTDSEPLPDWAKHV